MPSKLYHSIVAVLQALQDREIVRLETKIDCHIEKSKSLLILAPRILKTSVLLPELLVLGNLDLEVGACVIPSVARVGIDVGLKHSLEVFHLIKVIFFGVEHLSAFSVNVIPELRAFLQAIVIFLLVMIVISVEGIDQIFFHRLYHI